MGLLDFLIKTLDAPTDLQAIADRHRRLYTSRYELNQAIVRRLPTKSVHDGARRLGMLEHNTIVYKNESELPVLMDYCMYDVLHYGRSAVEQYAIDLPSTPGSDAMINLGAMQRAWYTVVTILDTVPGVGCHIQDSFADEPRFLADISFSNSGAPGDMMVTRLLDFGDFVASSGAALPLFFPEKDQVQHWLQVIKHCAGTEDFDPAELIRLCFEMGSSSYVRYASPSGEPDYEFNEDISISEAHPGFPSPVLPARDRKKRLLRRSDKASETRRCRCGSGKMFKNCCGKGR